MPYGDFVSLDRKLLSQDNSTLLVVVCSISPDFPQKTDILPKPYFSPFSSSFIAERSTISFSISDSTSSYQGEYLSMTLIKKGSMLSSNILSENDALSYSIFLNISSYSKFPDKHTINITSHHMNSPITSFDAFPNSYNIHKLSDYIPAHSNFLSLTCDSLPFIPITGIFHPLLT